MMAKKIVLLLFLILVLTPINKASINLKSTNNFINQEENVIVAVQNAWKLPNANVFRNNFIPMHSNMTLDTSIISWGVPVSSLKNIVTGDFDHDGFKEVAFIHTGNTITITSYRGLKLNKTYFLISLYGLLSADLNGDSYNELLCASSEGILEISSVDGSIKNRYNAKLIYNTILPVDIDNDSKEELIGANDSGIYIVSNSEVLKVFNVTGIVRVAVSGDLNGDNNLDYILISYDYDEMKGFATAYDIRNSIILWQNILPKDISYFPTTGDFDGDGNFEVAINLEDEILIFDDNGIKIGDIQANSVKNGFSVYDIDDDGKDELLFTSGSTLYAWSIEGTNITIINGFQCIPTLADLDGDSQVEIIGFMDSKLRIFNLSGAVEFTYPMKFYSTGGYVVVDDIENDGLLDVIARVIYWGFWLVVEFRSMHLDFSWENYVTPPASAITYEVNRYHNYSELISLFKEIETAYPNRMKMFSIGKSWQNRTIWAVKISNGDTINKSSIMLIGAHHAREYITAEAALFTANVLVGSYGVDPTITQILDNLDVYIVPVMNPDGHEIALNQDEWMRKTAHPIDDDGDGQVDEDPPEDLNGDGFIEVYYYYDPNSFRFWVEREGIDNDGDGYSGEDPIGGVDPNRNYKMSWTNIGQYANPETDIYSGPTYLSEPENRAIDSLMNMTRSLLALSLHSGTETIFFPWGVYYRTIPEWDLIEDVAALGMMASGFSAMQACAIYEAYGSWDDHAYGYYNILAMTPEIFANESWPKYIDWQYDDDKKAWKYTEWGIKWLFNPFPDMIENVSMKVLNLFVSMGNWSVQRLLKDTTHPELNQDNIRIRLKYASTDFEVYAEDEESGIHNITVEMITNDGKQVIELYHRIKEDILFGSIPGASNISSVKIIVTNRAGLTTSIVIENIVDQEPPEILEIYRCPENPTNRDVVTISAKIGDRSGVETVILSYSSGTGWTNITMEYNPTNETFIAQIPAFSAGTNVQYKLYAKDKLGNWLESQVYSYTVSEYEETTGRGGLEPYVLITVGVLLVAISIGVYFIVKKRKL